MQRSRLIANLRQDAAAKNATILVEPKKGKGSHTKVTVNGAFTFIPDRDIDPVTEKKIRKTLGL